MSDLIDRQAAIDALVEILDRPNHAEFLYGDEICGALGSLPSAQPTQNERVNSNNPLDCISREAAIETVKESFECGWYLLETISHIEELSTIDAVPVVRCGECVHYIKHDKRCGIWNHGGIVPYGFCFLGERRTDEETIHQYHERHKEVLKEMSMPVGRNVMDALRERRTDETD